VVQLVRGIGSLRYASGLVVAGLLAASSVGAQGIFNTPYTIQTIAGAYGAYGNLDGTNAAAQFEQPAGVTVDTNDNVYLVDSSANVVRLVVPAGTNWVTTTIAGTANASGIANGTNQTAQFNAPAGIARDAAGNLYVADTGNNAIRKIQLVGTNWVTTTIAGTAGAFTSGAKNGTNGAAQFYNPAGLAADAAGNLYVADTGNNAIRKIQLVGTNWVTTTIAGTAGLFSYGSNDGTNGAAQFNYPSGIAADPAGNLFVADSGNFTIREIVRQGTNWVTTTIAGTASPYGSYADGTNGDAQFNFSINSDLAVDATDNIFVADSEDGVIREVAPQGTNWVTTSLAGWIYAPAGNTDGTGTNAVFSAPTGIAVDAADHIFVTDPLANDVREGVLAAVPNPVISLTGPASVTVSWSGFGVLQTNATLNTSNWGNYGGSISTSNGTNSVTLPAPSGNLFFRLTN